MSKVYQVQGLAPGCSYCSPASLLPDRSRKSMCISKVHGSFRTPCSQNVEWSDVPKLLTYFHRVNQPAGLNSISLQLSKHPFSPTWNLLLAQGQINHILSGPRTIQLYRKRKVGNMKDICCVGLSPGPHWNHEKLWPIK